MILNYEEKRILIWGKTYPELSTKYYETVCTGGVLEDGTPVRLYPIPLRYCEEAERFKKYQWITARIKRNLSDSRPESHRVESGSIVLHDVIPTTKDEWGKRQAWIFKNPNWQFDTVDDLLEAQRRDKTSIGVVTPREIVGVNLVGRSKDEADTFEKRKGAVRRQLEADRQQLDLFEELMPAEMKRLDFVGKRFMVEWKCNSPQCKTHKMQILDWELIELQRREGDEKARQKLESVLDLKAYALRFFLGNLFLHPHNFTIVGLWYPRRAAGRLF